MNSECTSCASVNQKAPICPLRQNGAIPFTDFRPRCAVNAELVSLLENNNMLNSSYEARMFLQHNADKLMEMNRNRAMERLAPCVPCKRPFEEDGTMNPERYVVRCTPVSCQRVEVNPNGVGDGRVYK